MTARAPCDVPGCRRTIRRRDLPAHHCNFLCSKHYGLIPRVLKRVKSRHEREFRKYGFYPREAAYHRLCSRIWRLAGA